MRTEVLLGLLGLLCLCHCPRASSHVLGRPSSTSDLAQLKSLLERLEESLAEAAQEEQQEKPDADYEGTNQESDRGPANQGWALDPPEVDEAEGRSRATSQRSRLADLLLTRRSCFGARMDRIGNASGLGCNSGRG